MIRIAFMVINYGMAVSKTEFMIRFSGSKNTQFFIRLVYYPLWQYLQNFEHVTGWREGIINYPNYSYGHRIWYGSLHDRIYDPIQWFQKYSVFLRLVYYPLWPYLQNFERATGWRDGIIIDPNHSYGHKIWYSSLYDRIYDLIQWLQKYSVFPLWQYCHNFERATW